MTTFRPYNQIMLLLLRDSVRFDFKLDNESASYWRVIQDIVTHILISFETHPLILGGLSSDFSDYYVPQAFSSNALGYSQYEKYWIFSIQTLFIYDLVRHAEPNPGSTLMRLERQLASLYRYQDQFFSNTTLESIKNLDSATFQFITGLVREMQVTHNLRDIIPSRKLDNNLGWQ